MIARIAGDARRRFARRCVATEQVREIAARYGNVEQLPLPGPAVPVPGALEGALKLKEISYIHAEGYPAAEMKHGPIALVDEDTPSVFVMPRGSILDKMMSNMRGGQGPPRPGHRRRQRRRRRGRRRSPTRSSPIPDVPEYLQPLVAVVPLQLLAYHVALLRGCDVDKPRNLAKSVTVE